MDGFIICVSDEEQIQLNYTEENDTLDSPLRRKRKRMIKETKDIYFAKFLKRTNNLERLQWYERRRIRRLAHIRKFRKTMRKDIHIFPVTTPNTIFWKLSYELWPSYKNILAQIERRDGTSDESEASEEEAYKDNEEKVVTEEESSDSSDWLH